MLLPVFFAEGLTAFCVLAFEIATARLVAPYAGMSTDTWTAIIAAFLLALAFGNHCGGRLGTNACSARMLALAASAMAAGGIMAAITPLMMPAWDALILAPAPSQLWRIIVFVALPCIPVGFLFGIATPLLMTAAITLAGPQRSVVGLVYAIGAAGSVCGVLITLWLLLDVLGTRATMMTIGALALMGAALVAATLARRPVSVR